jgi:23S rRNA (uracil1939-C5)-methyltransferase
MRRRDILRVTIEDLAYGGKGVAKYEGKVIFVDGALPGDTVDACLTKIRGSYCESYAKELITPSPQRIKPLCEHFGTCGGCKWQNYEYPSQLKYKEEQLRRQLIHLGGIAEPPTEPIIGAKKLFHYRNKMEYSFGISESGELILGLHHAGSYDKIFDMHKCHLQSETANDIVNFVKDECRRLNLPSYNMITHEGLMRFLVIRDGKHTGEYMVNILTGPDYQPHKQGIMELGMNLARKFESIKSLHWTVNSQKSNIARWDTYPSETRNGVLSGNDHIHEQLGHCRYRISPDSFFQTNSYQAQVLYDTVIDFSGFSASDKVLDLYCGTGTIAIYVANLVGSIFGVESVSRAVEDAVLNAKENGVSNVKFQRGEVENIINDLGKFNKVIVDPPRAGLHKKALQGIIDMAPPVIIYVSCNPSTLARDVAILKQNGYRLDRAVAVDMFPHTYHIEAVTKLVRE